MKILIYTFRTNPFKKDLKKEFKNLIVFGKLKEDLIKFEKILLEKKPKFILGCAKEKFRSAIESKAINKFNKGKISHEGPEFFKLFTPKTKLFKMAKDSTHSFCNWSFYKLSEIISKNKLETKLIFVHFKESDFDKLKLLIKKLK